MTCSMCTARMFHKFPLRGTNIAPSCIQDYDAPRAPELPTSYYISCCAGRLATWHYYKACKTHDARIVLLS